MTGKQVLLWLSIFMLTGCRMAPRATATSIPITLSPTAVVSTITPSATIAPTDTVTPTLTVSPTATATEIAAPSVDGFQWAQDAPVSACIPIQPALPAGTHLSGLILAGETGSQVLDPNTGEISNRLDRYEQDDADPLIRVSHVHPDSYRLSPDGKWLAHKAIAYNTSNNVTTAYQIIVEPAANVLSKSSTGRFVAWELLPKPEDDLIVTITGWLNNTQIAIAIKNRNGTNNTTIVRNVFTREEKTFVLEQLPDFQTDPSGWYMFGKSDMLPDPTLSRLIYAAQIEIRTHATLWDVANKKTISSPFYWAPNPSDAPPGWSLDGSDFISQGYATEENKTEWFVATRDGEVRQLTHFRDYLPNVTTGGDTRSADGRYLAFSAFSNDYQSPKILPKILVMDLKSTPPQGFCVSANSITSPTFSRPVWSPDSKYIVVSSNEGGYPANWTLVDIEKREAYQIATNITEPAAGWMAVDQALPTYTPTSNISPTPSITP